jgi:fused signal recognition particle receptor
LLWFLGADSRFPLQSFTKRDFLPLTLQIILFTKGFPLQSGLGLQNSSHSPFTIHNSSFFQMSFFKKLFSSEKKEANFTEEARETLDKGLEQTKTSFFSKLTKAVAGKSKVDDEVLDNLEEVLVGSDVGVETTLKIITRIEKRVAEDKYLGTDELNRILRDEIAALLSETNSGVGSQFTAPADKKPYVLMVVGVNGVGKTTTIGKLAYQFKKQGYNVVLGAADTFRAAAIDQLQVWADRVGVPLVKQQMGSDPASVAFDTLQSAVAQNADIVIIDTAGRLHNKLNLMNELTKVKRVMQKVIEDAPHDVLLVLDGSTGQNAFEQAKQFTAATEVTSLAVTKLDGTAKGGVVIGISDQFQIPVKYIGVGEGIQDLQVFNKYEFVDSFFK